MLSTVALSGAVAASFRRTSRAALTVVAASHPQQTFAKALSSLSTAPLANRHGHEPHMLCLRRASFATLNTPSDTHNLETHEQRKTKRTTTVIVGPLPLEMDEAELSKLLSVCGEILHVRIRRNPLTGASLSYGYAKFSSPRSVDMALELDGIVMGDRPVRIRALVQYLDEVHVRGLSWDVDEDKLRSVFERCGKVVRAAIRSSKHGRRETEVHGFVRFLWCKSASKALQLNGTELVGRPLAVSLSMPRSRHVINEAVQGGSQSVRSIMVTNLPPQVDDDWLKATFQTCGDIVLTRIQRRFLDRDSNRVGAGHSLGFGYVRFTSTSSVTKALELDGQLVAGHALQVRPSLGPSFVPEIWPHTTHDESKFMKNAIWVKNLAHGVDEGQLRREFERFGEVVKVHIPRDTRHKLRNFGFVTFASRQAVDEAIDSTLKITVNGFSVKIRRAFPPGTRKPEDTDLHDVASQRPSNAM